MLQLNSPSLEETIQRTFNSEIQQKRVRKGSFTFLSELGFKHHISINDFQY